MVALATGQGKLAKAAARRALASADTSGDLFSTVNELYAEIYAESPYDEGPAEVEGFTSG